MIVYFYSVLPLLLLPVDSSSIRDRNFKNDLVPSLSSRLDPLKKDSNSLKIVSNEPFIIQLQMPNSGESPRRESKEKDTKRKRPTKKRISKIKALRKRHRRRRDLQNKDLQKRSNRESEKEKHSKLVEVTDPSKNTTKNSISRVEILNALSSYSIKSETKKRKEDVKNFDHDENRSNENAKYTRNGTPESITPRFWASEKASLLKNVYPSTPKTDRRSHKYTYKDLMTDRERLEKKIKYIRNMLNVSNADDLIRVRRRSESDRTANKIAKMFLTLSAVNGLHDRLKSKCDAEDEDENYRAQDIWEKEREENPSRKSSSSNEERYKVKKWIELMKSKRSSSKSCPCVTNEHDEESEIFPLEQKLPKNYYLFQKGGSSEESSEAYRDPLSVSREKPNRNNHYKRRNHKARDDHDNKMKTLGGRGNKKFDLPLDDLEVYRSRAKQILQNAEEILDRIKEEEEKRLSAPNSFMNQLKELTSRIQTDPRNNENDLIRKIQKNLGWGPTPKSPDGSEGHNFLENVKSFILDPYEKAKALTDESTRKLSSYLLRNLAELQESEEMKKNDEDKEESRVFFGQIPQKEEEKPLPANLARENFSDSLPNSKEDPQNWTDTVSATGGDHENQNIGDVNIHQEEQFKKRMQEIIKEQEKKLNEYEPTPESEENSQESLNTVSTKKEKEGKDETVEPEVSSVEGKEIALLEQKASETINDPEHKETENYEKNEVKQESAREKSDFFSKENNENNEEVSKHLKNEEIEKEVLQEKKRDFDENDKNTETEIASELIKVKSSKTGEKEAKSVSEDLSSVDSNYEKLNDQKKMEEVAVATSEEKENVLESAVNAESENLHNSNVLGSLHFLTAESDESFYDQTYEKIDPEKAKDLEETKFNEEPVAKGQKNLEIDSVHERNSESEKDNEASVSANAESVNLGDEESSKSMKSKEEKEDPQKKEEETLKQETPDEDDDKVGEENLRIDDTEGETSQKDQMSKAAEDNEDKESLGMKAINDENSNEGYDNSKKGLLDNEQNLTEEPPLVSENAKDQQEKNSKKFSEEISEGDLKGEDSQSFKSEKALETEKNRNFSEVINGESEKIENLSKEGADLLKAAKNSQSVEVTDGDAKHKTTEMTNTSQDEMNEKTEKSENSEDTLLKPIIKNQNQEESDKEVDETNRTAENRNQNENENSENQSDHPEVDKKFAEVVKFNREINEKGNLESLMKKSSGEIFSEEKKNEESSKGLEASDPTFKSTESEQETDNVENGAANESATLREEKHSEELEKSAENKEETSLLRASASQDFESLKDKTEGELSENSDDTLKANLENKNLENFNEDDIASGKAKSGELIVSRENLKSEEDERSERVEPTLNDENDDEPSSKEANLEEDGNKPEEDESSSVGDMSLRVTLNKENLQEDGNKPEEGESSSVGDMSLRVTLNKENLQEDGNKPEEGESSTVGDMSLKVTLNKEDRSALEDADETISKAANIDADINAKKVDENERTSESITNDSLMETVANVSSEEKLESADEVSLKATNSDKDSNREVEENENANERMNDFSFKMIENTNEESVKDADESRVSASKDDKKVHRVVEENEKKGDEETIEDTSLRSIVNKNDEEIEEDADKGSLTAENTEKDSNRNGEENESGSDDVSLKATVNKNREGNENADDGVSLKDNLNDESQSVSENSEEIALKETNNVSDVSVKRMENSNGESAEKALEGTEDGDISLRVENPRNTHKESRNRENGDGEEISFKTESSEESVNNVDGDDHEKIPLPSTTDSNDAELFKGGDKEESKESKESSRSSNNFGDRTEETGNDDTLTSANLFGSWREESVRSNEVLGEENTSGDSEESEEQPLSEENDSALSVADPIRGIKSKMNSDEENSLDNLRKHELRKKSLKVPSSIAQIMKDLEGKEKGDVTSIENLNPEKIDHIIDKIDEAEQQNKVIDDVDCRKECACAENIDNRSRNIGRYEIVKDFLYWMKDLKLNRVLSDD